MPVKLSSRLPAEGEARIEIIPLIDIMFFLLAAFMLVSLSMVNMKSVKVNLPTATTAIAKACASQFGMWGKGRRIARANPSITSHTKIDIANGARILAP